MIDYTVENPVFSPKISIVEEEDLVNADNDTAAAKQLIENDLALAARLDKVLGNDGTGESPGFADGIKAGNIVGAINEVFTLGSEKKSKLVENLTAMGIEASTDETWEQLLDKVLDMTDTSNDTVTAAALLTGYTAHNAAGEQISGIMPDKGAWTGDTTGNGNVTIPAGYHNGQGYVSGAGAYAKGMEVADARANTDSANYKTGYSAGVSATKKGTAGTGDVLAGKTFTNASSVGAAGAMDNKGSVTVDAGAVTQDDDYTYLDIPAAAFYDANSKIRTKNSNIGNVYCLGTGTSFDIKSKFPNAYQKFTKNNFLVTISNACFEGRIAGVSDGRDIIGDQKGGISINYDNTTGMLAISPDRWYTNATRTSDGGWHGYDNIYFHPVYEAYLIYGSILKP